MNKVTIALLALVMVSINANACSVTYLSASDQVDKVLDKTGFGFDNYNDVCEKLNHSNAQLIIDGSATVLSGKSIGWASVSLGDVKLPIITTDFGGVSTKVNDFASQNIAEELLLGAINSAINSMTIDKAIESLNQQRKKIKEAYTKAKK